MDWYFITLIGSWLGAPLVVAGGYSPIIADSLVPLPFVLLPLALLLVVELVLPMFPLLLEEPVFGALVIEPEYTVEWTSGSIGCFKSKLTSVRRIFQHLELNTFELQEQEEVAMVSLDP